MTLPRLKSLDELQPGDRYELGRLTFSLEDIREFARRYDPQPFHLDEEAARDSVFGTVVAAGLHTLSACFGMLMASPLLQEISLAGSAMDIRWPAPLRPGEEVTVSVEVIEVTRSRARKDRGSARLRYVARRVEDGVVVLDATGLHHLRR
ncbi:MaoC family dehydratase N-terminal domain-containing protein [Roseomonas sp. SSH11]|uniref:MaoC family dehydratase N-terminal domain-containing protein n=1 Tax=Pararoseomonas baculiformis TaxID=2820812 RepID=A0ABS4AG35_9PROT|nr:MaoC/PaaZ C-terminal domain-containing protein [Pararoseomonas baculiformis]MBP0445987.1 MaoC family dehydratase N-terminal domain-containing protein [Pararoseomonas baculiformis]